jgi:deoxyribodipyrimidine photo-lyase
MSSMPSKGIMLSVNFANQEYRSVFFFKDQVVLKKRNYKSRWIAVPYIHHLKINGWINIYGTTTLEYTGSSTSSNFHKSNYVFPSLGEIGFEESNVKCFLII